MNVIFVENAVARLQDFLKKNNQNTRFEVLTPDASTREYFRVSWNGKSAIACVYGEAFKAAEHSYLDVTALFKAEDLPVAKIYEFDEDLGIVVQEDFGDTILRDFLRQSDEETRDEFTNRAISLIARIQSITPVAFERNSIASRLKFDEGKLVWELNFFKTHYFETYRRTNLLAKDDAALTAEFAELARALEARARVLCHRDFHAANLMLDRENNLRIIDHQDARIGAASYDLVSLLLDRVLDAPAPEWLDAKKKYFLFEREKLDLETIDWTNFDEEFQMQTVQRCLKAIGTFSFQSTVRGKTHFIPYIEPMFLIVRQAAEKLNRFPRLQNIISEFTEK
jgi:aminoglycoside/choline kinase family phosphotransferase